MDKNTRKHYLPHHGDRRNNWARHVSPSNKQHTPTQTNTENEDTSALAELTLRLELNGINIKDATRSIGTLWDPMEDDRIHPSRKKQIPQEGRKLEQQKTHNKWEHDNWVTLDVASIESEMPPPKPHPHKQQDTKPVRPIRTHQRNSRKNIH